MQTKLLKDVDNLLCTFCCGSESIDFYFQNKALKDDDAVTYCFLDDDLKTIIALSSLSCNGIIVESSNKLYTYPAVEVKMFAVNNLYKSKLVPDGEGMNWSDLCFSRLMAEIGQFTSLQCGASRVFLYSVADAVHFYSRQGMHPFGNLLHGDDRKYLEGCTPMLMLI